MGEVLLTVPWVSETHGMRNLLIVALLLVGFGSAVAYGASIDFKLCGRLYGTLTPCCVGFEPASRVLTLDCEGVDQLRLVDVRKVDIPPRTY